jgi:hypothetical protein
MPRASQTTDQSIKQAVRLLVSANAAEGLLL